MGSRSPLCNLATEVEGCMDRRVVSTEKLTFTIIGQSVYG